MGWLASMHRRSHDRGIDFPTCITGHMIGFPICIIGHMGGRFESRGLHPGFCIHLGLHPSWVDLPLPPCRHMEYYGIRSTSWRYTSHWNALLMLENFQPSLKYTLIFTGTLFATICMQLKIICNLASLLFSYSTEYFI